MLRLLLTGSPGIGKTTVIRRILKTIQGVQCSGFYTEERRERGQRRGFKIRTLDGEEVANKMRWLQRLGDPYTDEQIAGAAEAVEGRTEMEALIAYLQDLGTTRTGR